MENIAAHSDIHRTSYSLCAPQRERTSSSVEIPSPSSKVVLAEVGSNRYPPNLQSVSESDRLGLHGEKKRSSETPRKPKPKR